MKFIGNNKDVVLFVKDILTLFEYDLQLTTITVQARLGVCSVNIVTDMLWEGTVLEVAKLYSLERTNISPENTQDG